MNLELIMAIVVLYFGLKITYNVLSLGNPQQAIEKKKESLARFEKSSKNTSAYFIAYLLVMLTGLFLIYISVSWLYPHFG